MLWRFGFVNHVSSLVNMWCALAVNSWSYLVLSSVRFPKAMQTISYQNYAHDMPL